MDSEIPNKRLNPLLNVILDLYMKYLNKFKFSKYIRALVICGL
jgi:hypothetical protein